MYEPINNFLELVSEIFFEPLSFALDKSRFLKIFFDVINQVIQSILGIENIFNAEVVASIFSFFIVVWLFLLVFKLFKYCFNFVKNAINGIIDKYSFRKEWRRKK